MQKLPVKAVVLVFLSSASIQASLADDSQIRWTSVARSLSTDVYGFSYNFGSEIEAQQSAYESCQARAYRNRDCVTFYSSNKPGVYVYANGSDLKGVVSYSAAGKERAIEKALQACEQTSENCEWRHWWSNAQDLRDEK